MASEVRDDEDVCSLELRDYPGTFPAAKFSAEHTPKIRKYKTISFTNSIASATLPLFLYRTGFTIRNWPYAWPKDVSNQWSALYSLVLAGFQKARA